MSASAFKLEPHQLTRAIIDAIHSGALANSRTGVSVAIAGAGPA